MRYGLALVALLVWGGELTRPALGTAAQGTAAQQRRDVRQWYEAYDEGVRAAGAGQWQNVVDNLLAAKRLRPQQSRRVSFYGDRVDAYIPDYYLGVAYLNLRQYAEAEAALGRVRTANLVARGDRLFQAFEASAASARFEGLLARAEQFMKQGDLTGARKEVAAASQAGGDTGRVASLVASITDAENAAKVVLQTGGAPGAPKVPLPPENDVKQTAAAAPPVAPPIGPPAPPPGAGPNVGVPPAGEFVAVPDLLGRTERSAATLLGQARLRVGAVSPSTTASRSPVGSIIGQSPAAGARVAAGTAVSLSVVAPTATAAKNGPTGNPALAEATAIRAFFSGDYGAAAQGLEGLATPRARFFLASSLAALVLVGERDDATLDTAKQQLAQVGSMNQVASDRRLVSPRILSSLGVEP